MEVIGWVGTVLVIVAYYPQIHHLFVERCAWGISVLTWLIWLLASILLLTYCILRREVLLCVAQGINITAIVTTLILVRRSNSICPYHRQINETITRQ
ncbi:MAG TPA: PQ-loop repeat-containing protein [Pyrinomonadaceae bacterium]